MRPAKDRRQPLRHRAQRLASVHGRRGQRRTFQAPQGMYLQKVLKLLWRRRLPTLRAHDVPPVSKVPDWNTNLLTEGYQREGQHQSRTVGAHLALDLSSTHALPLLCHAPPRLLELAAAVFRSLVRTAAVCPWYLAATNLRPLYKSGPRPSRAPRQVGRHRPRPPRWGIASIQAVLSVPSWMNRWVQASKSGMSKVRTSSSYETCSSPDQDTRRRSFRKFSNSMNALSAYSNSAAPA